MKTTKTLAWVVALGALASSFLSCSQTPAACQVGQAGSGFGYATKFTVKVAPQGCPADFTPALGDIIGMASYHPITTGTNGSTTYNDHIISVAVQADTLGNQVLQYGTAGADTSTADHPYAFGTYTTESPNAQDQCFLGTVAPAVQDFKAVPASATSPGLPADNVSYAWNNFTAYVTAADQGVQFAGDVTITQNTCAVTYHAIGMWPSISCTGYDGKPDFDLCNPCSEPNLGRATGSGISPDALTACAQIFETNDPFSTPIPGPACMTDTDCANVSGAFTSTCIGATETAMGQCTYCQHTLDCPPSDACVGGFCFNRTPYFCVLAGTSDPPVLDPAPQTCEGTVMSFGNGSSGAGTTSSTSSSGGGGGGGTGGSGGTGGGSADAGG